MSRVTASPSRPLTTSVWIAASTVDLKQVATDGGSAGAEGQRFQELDAQFAEYTALIETGRADTRLGWPVGSAYLRAASATMHQAPGGILARRQ